MGEEAPEHELRIENVRSLLVDLTEDEEDEKEEQKKRKGAVPQESAEKGKKRKKWTVQEEAKVLPIDHPSHWTGARAMVLDAPDMKLNLPAKPSHNGANTALPSLCQRVAVSADSQHLPSSTVSSTMEFHSVMVESTSDIEVLRGNSTDTGVNGIVAYSSVRYVESDTNNVSDHSWKDVAESSAKQICIADCTQGFSSLTVTRMSIENIRCVSRDALLLKYLEKEKSDSIFFCKMCETYTLSLSHLLDHNCLSTLNPVNVEDQVVCNLCGEGFSFKSQLANHMCVRLVCCSKLFPSIPQYMQHDCASSNKLQKYVRFFCHGCKKSLISITLLGSENNTISMEPHCSECKLSSCEVKCSSSKAREGFLRQMISADNVAEVTIKSASDDEVLQGNSTDTGVNDTVTNVAVSDVNNGTQKDPDHSSDSHTRRSPAAKQSRFFCSCCHTAFDSDDHTCENGKLLPQDQSTANSPNSYICKHCSVMFLSKALLDSHTCKTVSTEHVLTRKNCLSDFKSGEESNYKRSTTGSDFKTTGFEDSSPGPFCCPSCNKVFHEVHALALHMYSCCYRQAIQRVPPMPLVLMSSCSVCSKKCDLSTGSDWHVCVSCSQLKCDATYHMHPQDKCSDIPMYRFEDIDKLCLWCGLEMDSKEMLQTHLQENCRCLLKTLKVNIWMCKHDTCMCCGIQLKGEEAHKQHYMTARWCMYRWLTSMHQIVCDSNCWKHVPCSSGGQQDFHCVKCGHLFATNLRRMEHFLHNSECLKYHLRISPLAFPCLNCGACFASEKQRHTHEWNCKNSQQASSCHACGQQFLSLADCENHIRFSPECARSFPCMLCMRSFDRLENRAAHFLEKQACRSQHLLGSFKMYVCQSCFSCFITSDSHRKHVMNSSQCITVQGGKCSKCCKVFADLEGHCRLKVACNKAQRQVAPLGFLCWGCGRGYVTKEGLSDHLSFCASEERWLWKCEVCSACFETRQEHQRHCKERLHCNRQGFKCWGCWRTFQTANALKQHLPDCSGHWKGGWCTVCLQHFSDLEAHCKSSNPCAIAHRAVNPATFICWGCLERFLTRQGLRGHLRDYPHCPKRKCSSLTVAANCVGCLDTYTTLADLKNHFMNKFKCLNAMQHTFGWGFGCIKCGKLLISMENVLEHVTGSSHCQKMTLLNSNHRQN